MRKLLILAALLSTPAFAETSATVSLTTDYIARGTSQTYNKPAVTVYAETSTDEGLYAGVFAANVDFDDGTKLEVDPMVGYRFTAGDVALDVGAMYISYYGSQPTNWNMFEGHVSATKTFGTVTTTAYVGVSPDYFNYAGLGVWGDLSASVPAGPLTLSGSLGYQYVEKDVSYTTWSVGASHEFGPGFSADVKYYDTDWKKIGVKYLDKIYAPRVTLSLRKTF